MIPKNYVKLEKFPINANGKINKKALLEIECKNIKSQNYEGPKDNVEKQVLEIWYEILGIKNIGVNEKFFDVGGHSLKAAIMANKIYGRFNVSFPLSDLFKNPSVREVSDKIKQIIENSANEEYLNNEEIILLKQGKNKTKNIFFVHSAVNAVECYAKLSKHLNQDFNCWGIKATQVELYSAQKIQVEEIAKDYVQRIKKIQPNGPYYISGWCIAGIIAYEIAKQLENMNDKVEFLGLINSPLVKQESIGLRFITKLKYIHEKEGVVLKKVIRNTKFENKYKDNINKENVWDLFINELDSNDSYEIEKEIIFNNICLYEPSCRNLFSNYKSMELKEMLLKFNIMRSLINAIYCNYSLREKINANIYYYVAGKDKIKNMELWKNHTNKSLIVHYIDSKHFEIFDGEECSCLGDKFNESIS